MKVNYDQLSEPYRNFRTPDKRIAAAIFKHTKDAKNVINVGAGTGAYEPTHCKATAIEPSLKMIAKRQKSGTKLIQGFAENLPFNDNTFDVAMGILTIHHWTDIAKGLNEMLRVAKQRVILLTWIDDSPK
ncbi:MAG: class I SAM-dependent methyltransferase, partial [Gammaproteobacteria bacterium]|nr:class I SAM-dependent methyltransferase [Gammaproteobacteria bacterium]